MRTDTAISHRPSALSRTIGRVRSMADGRWLMALFGMPDYDRYLLHARRCHPDGRVMTEAEYVRSEFERKYAGGGGRCC